jgi:hypothetical protein
MGHTLAGMVHERHRRVILALQRSQIGEEGCDLTGDILIDRMEAHEGVENDELRPKVSDGGL